MQASLAKPLRAAAPTRRVVASRRTVAPKAFSDVNTVIGGGECWVGWRSWAGRSTWAPACSVTR